MKRLFVLPLILAFLLMLPVTTANADVWARGVSETSGYGTWFDAEKDSDNAGDDLLCWAATAANILAWSGWDAGYIPKTMDGLEDSIFDFLEAEEPTSRRGWMEYAWKFWFDGSELDDHFKDSTHPGYYTTAEFTANYYEDMTGGSDVLDDIADLLRNDYGVGIAVRGTMSHAVTVWGLETNASGDYTGIWLTDSDNNDGGPDPRPNELIKYGVALSGSTWYLQDFYGTDSNYIDEIQALKYVPIPGAVLLGLLGLSVAGIKLRKRV